jgi:hypothetical protein
MDTLFEYGHDLDMKKESKEGDMAKNNNNGKVIHSRGSYVPA